MYISKYKEERLGNVYSYTAYRNTERNLRDKEKKAIKFFKRIKHHRLSLFLTIVVIH